MTKAFKNAVGILVVTAVAGISFASSAQAASGYTHTRTLKVGSRNLAVESLQEALNACWDAGLTADGIFGKGTRSAVMAAQKDLGLKADGIVGPMTGAAIEDCDGEVVTTPTTPTTPGTTTTWTGGPEVRTRNFQIRNASNSSVEEGSRGVEIARVQFDTQYSDAKIERIDIVATPNGSVAAPTTPWRVFDRVMVRVNDTQVASFETSNATMWDEVSSGVYRLRMSGLSAVLPKDRTQNISLWADINSGANGNVGDAKWDISLGLDNQGIRLVDQAGITQYVGLQSVVSGTVGTNASATNAASISIKNIGGLSTVRVTAGPNDPSSKTLVGSKTASSSPMLVQSFTIKAEQGDVKIKTLPVNVVITEGALTGASQVISAAADYGVLYKALVDSTWVEINGTRFDSISSKAFTVSAVNAYNGTTLDTETNTINFDINRNFTVTSGSTATVNVYVKLQGLADNGSNPNVNSGATISSSVSGSALMLETGNYDSIPSGSVTGSATGYTHTIRTTGVVVTKGTTTNRVLATDDNGIITKVEYSIPVTLQAFGNTFYIGQTAQYAATVSSTNAFAVSLQTSAAPTTHATLPAGYSTDITISSDAPVQGSGLRLDDGQTRNATIKVTLTGDGTAASTSYRAALKQLKFFTDSGLSTGATVMDLIPAENYRTDYQLID